jgi:hypothetical protein
MANQIHSSIAEVAAIVPEVWSSRFQELNRAALPFIDSVSRDYQGEIGDLGDTLNISQIPDFSEAGLLAEGAAGDAEAVTVSQQQMVINNRPYKDYIITKKAQLQSLEFMDQLREHAVYSIQKKMQQMIIDAIVPSAATPDHQIAYDSGSTLALADILEAKELLMASDVPQERLNMVLGAAQWSDLYNITGFTSRDFVPAGSPLANGEFAVPLVGFQPKFTSVVSNTAYLFNASFLALVVQQDLGIEVASMAADGVRGMRVEDVGPMAA